ncbi:MAG TPA: arginine--tRNA ligase, partial [Syntrophales bacterium]|nr:arginine--tRNA ligase [Syntrophales bacterium]
MKKRLYPLIEQSLVACMEKGLLPEAPLPPFDIEPPREKAHGDYATNAAMVLASAVRRKPRDIARALVDHLDDAGGWIEKVEIAGPGFINFFMKGETWAALLRDVDELRDRYGFSDLGRGRRVQVEFVSANPTGPLHIGHGRGAVVGDVIANLLTATGHAVSREYYINDAGNQMNTLGRSVLLRYRELLGERIDYPGECYQGSYIADLAREIADRHGSIFLDRNESESIVFFREYAGESILQGIKEDLRVFGVVFDHYFNESELYREDGVRKLLEELERKGFIYRDGVTLWFKTTDFGDEKDRVVIRENGEPTYFAADIAYHLNKYGRHFDKVIDIWGADHHGYIPRMYAGIQALGYPREALEVVLVQLVNLLREGTPVAMSTRSGEFVTLREVVDEVGRDGARYNFLMRRSNSHLDFDLEIAKKQSNENPVYYVQYGHARICSILRTALEKGYAVPRFEDVDLRRLDLPEEAELIRTIDRFPELIEGSARALEPHRIPFYLNDLAALFHSYYNKNRVLSDDRELSLARLFLVHCIGITLRNALGILGVAAPERM